MTRFSPKRLGSPALLVFLVSISAAYLVGTWAAPTWVVEKIEANVESTDEGSFHIDDSGNRHWIERPTPISRSNLTVDELKRLSAKGLSPEKTEAIVFEVVASADGEKITKHYRLLASRHWQYWSFLPALVAIVLCWMTKEPISSLLAGIVVGGLLLGQANVLDEVLIPSIGTTKAATILILYLWLLGGLLGIWARTGASKAFADYVSTRFVTGPRSAKFVAWILGVVFFQGGTVSAVLAGTTVRPLADKARVSHEELSLIVDSTASPIAVLLAFNAWPIYIQGLIGVTGVSYLATESDRVAFFFRCVPFSFYAILSVLFAFLLSIEKLPWMSRKLRNARNRAADTGQLDAPGSEPLADRDLGITNGPEAYSPHILDFLLPLFILLGVAIGTYIYLDSPQIVWAFSFALLVAAVIAWLKGMGLNQIVQAIIEGQKGAVLGSVILLLAITIGSLSKDVGGGRYLASLLEDLPWYWILPATAFLIAVVISFSTGSSWATFAVTLPLVIPLANAIATSHGLSNPELYTSICFVACLNGGVFGDQCSPISDTTILSAMSTGADLMDHVTTQLPIAVVAAVLAMVGWTAMALLIT